MERFQDAGFFQTLFDTVPAFMFIVDADVRVRHLNAAAMKLVGGKRRDILLKRGGEVIHCVHSSETPGGCGTAPACRDCVMRSAAGRVFSKGERVSRETIEMQLVEGGEARQVYLSVTAAPLRYMGENLALLILEDVTAQKRAEEAVRAALQEKETLLKELYHRTKNNMNVISSLLAIGERRAAGDPKALCPFKEMQTRIQAMALVHEKLYKSQDLHNLDIREYIEDLARSIHSGFRSEGKKISLKLDLESIPFQLDQAIPCGLIINELMSNALKYAFDGRQKGRIGISLRAMGKDSVEIVFSDDGKGLPEGLDVKNAKSLGLKIVHTLVRGQLEGEIECETGRSTIYRIRFRLSRPA